MRSWLDVLGKRTGTGGGHNLRADDPVCIEAKRLVSQHRCEGKKTTPKEAKRECVKTILKRGRETGCTSGKITLFVSKNIADEVWSTIANLVTEGLGEIGRGAKGEERSDELIHHSAIINSLLLVASLFAPLIAGCYAKISPLKGVPETGRYGRLCLGVYNEHFDNLKEIKMIQDRLIEVMRDYDSEDYDVCGYKPDIYTCLGIYGRTQKEWGNIGANLYSRNDLEEGKGGMAAPYMFVYSSPDWEPDSSVASNSSSSPPPPVYPSNFPASPEIYTLSLHDALPISCLPRDPWLCPLRVRDSASLLHRGALLRVRRCRRPHPRLPFRPTFPLLLQHPLPPLSCRRIPPALPLQDRRRLLLRPLQLLPRG